MWKSAWVAWNVICWLSCLIVNRLWFHPSWRSKFLFLHIYLNSFRTLLDVRNVLRRHLVILRRVLIDRKPWRILDRDLVLRMRRWKLLHLVHRLRRIHPIICRCWYRHHVRSWHVHSLHLLSLLNFRTIFFIRIFNLFLYSWHHWFVNLNNYRNIKLFTFKRFLTYFVQSILCLFFRIELDNDDSFWS